MNENVRKELARISANTPPELADKLIREVVDTSLEENVRAMIADRHTPYKTAENLKDLLEKGAFRRSDTVVDPKVAKEMERYNEMMVEKARKNGTLPDPMEDKFWRERVYRIKKMKGL